MSDRDAFQAGDRGASSPLPEVLRDDATGLPNQLYFDAVYGTVFHIGRRGIPVSLAVFEVPGAGDAGQEEQADLGALILDITRQSDLPARVAPDEIVLVLLDCNIHGGRIVAERVMEGLMPWAAEHRLTVRGGLAVFADEMEGPRDLLEKARSALERTEGAGGSIEVA